MPSSSVDVVIPNSKPRAVVLLFGWFASQRRHVNKYASLYHDRDCATVTGTADTLSILTFRKPTLDAFALEAAKRAIEVLKEHPEVPVIAHVFSGGGCSPLQRLETLIHKANRAHVVGTVTDTDRDLVMLGKAMENGGQILDSAPVYPDPMSVVKAIATSGFQFKVLQWLLQGFFLLFILLDAPLVWGHANRAEQNWYHVMDRPLTARQAFVYSTMDEITNHKKLEELIDYRQRLVGKENILVLKFEDSDHVMHQRKHPGEYASLVDDMVKLVESGPPVTVSPGGCEKRASGIVPIGDDESTVMTEDSDSDDEDDEHIIIGGVSFRI